MKTRLLQVSGLILLSVAAAAASAGDLGGISAHFTPEEARPGDLVTLEVALNREDYGEFDLDLPSHPNLHLVTREQVPPRLEDGRYYQGERLILQALSSGEVTLTGMTVQLTEASGVRAVQLPDLILTVHPFDTIDEATTPEALPKVGATHGGNLPKVLSLVAVIVGALILFFLVRLKLAFQIETRAGGAEGARNFDSILRAARISNEDLEQLLSARGDQLSAGLRQDLETFLYAPDASDDERAGIHQRLRKELEG